MNLLPPLKPSQATAGVRTLSARARHGWILFVGLLLMGLRVGVAAPLDRPALASDTTESTALGDPAPRPLPATEPTPGQSTRKAASATATLPEIAKANLPPSVLLGYDLKGKAKGLTYYANSELQWQHNERAYAMSLSLKVFLLGTKYWRSHGDVTATGLSPALFSDIWRQERTTLFNRKSKQLIFSNKAPSVVLEPGAQDQISLYAQMAAAMATNPKHFQPGARLQIQTATIKDGLPWSLVLAGEETLQINQQDLTTVKWVCHPKNRLDSSVVFWLSPKHAWMPVRILITEANGNYIDMLLNRQEALPQLP